MPPLAQDAFAAAQQVLPSRWLEIAVAAISVACDPWVLALLALALFSWLERDVPSVLAAWAPLVIALALTTAASLGVQAVFGAPRPVPPGGPSLPAEVARAAVRTSGAGGQALAGAVVASYAIAAYGRRGLPALALALAGGLVRVNAGAHWVFEVAGGWVAGGLVGLLAWAAAVRLRPRGHLARLRGSRRRA